MNSNITKESIINIIKEEKDYIASKLLAEYVYPRKANGGVYIENFIKGFEVIDKNFADIKDCIESCYVFLSGEQRNTAINRLDKLKQHLAYCFYDNMHPTENSERDEFANLYLIGN